LPAIVTSVDVDRRPEDVFAYVTDPSRFDEWQESAVRGHIEGGGAQTVGSKCITTRRVGSREQTSTAEVTRLSPPNSWSVRGIDGPVRANVDVTIEPLDQGDRSHVTIRLEFIGRGIGRLIVPLFVRPQAAKEAPRSCQKLKQRLEQET